jgi:DNA polymerase-3 subunit beta
MLDILTGVSHAVSAKSSIPAIEGILFRCTNYLVTLTAYDLEIGITTTLPAEILDPGDIVINARLLVEMIKKLDADTVSIQADADLKVTVKGNLTQFNIMGIPAADFPEMPLPDTEDSLKIKGEELRTLIHKTIYAVSTSDQKPVHTGTKFIMDATGHTLVSVDGYRLAIARSKSAQCGGSASFVVPAKTLAEVSKLVRDDDEEVAIGTARRLAVFKFGSYTVVTRLLEGDFLDYAKSIPAGSKTTVRIHVDSFYDAVERASLIINDRFKSPVRMSFEAGLVTLTCATALGNAYDELPCEIQGEAVEIGFNNRYVLDALRHCGEEEIQLELNGPLSPMKVIPAEGDDFLFLVLPVRIKTDP